MITDLATKSKDEVDQWIDYMTDVQVRGLVHEFGQQLLRVSDKYHTRRENIETRGRDLNYSYFGLVREEATEKDLDVAYRKLARSMHPDKNGGTEEAKDRFQKMKSRYEELKESMAGAPPRNVAGNVAGPSGSCPPTAQNDTDRREEQPKETNEGDSNNTNNDKKRREAYEEDAPASSGDGFTMLVYEDALMLDRETLVAKAFEYLKQIKFVHHNMKRLDAEEEALVKEEALQETNHTNC